MYIFRLVLIGHTDCTTCNLRTTKQILYFFFLKGVCGSVCAAKCEVECVNLTASYLEFKYSSAMNLPFLNTHCKFLCLLRSDC